MTSRDDEAWRAIVENYGERPSLDDLGTETASGRRARPTGEGDPAAADPGPFTGPTGSDEAADDPPESGGETDDDFVPQPAPPLPEVPPLRRASWSAVLGIPILMLVLALTGWRPPTLVSLVAVVCFVAGFGYLVATMSRDPRDPWDNGAQV
ncbi:hypothetical protein [Nocardioides sp. 616]|uniref:hypothetical protein n=1 Tax=Nocardioides sp. 616 TaxID=2268090 RepID=UPI000CE40614|nr:hypothetical protein [Nocardioides sp. 616]